jgi:RNA polymerase sigma factor (sigma-70 family)
VTVTDATRALQGFADVHGEDATELLSQLRESLLRYCELMTGSHQDAEDITQSTLLKALPVLVGVREHPNAWALLRRIAKTTWLDSVRKNSRNALWEESADLALASAAASFFENAADGLEVEAALRQLIGTLTGQQRAVFLLCAVFDYSDTEAAELLNISRGAVKATLHRARLRLRRNTEKNDNFEVPDDVVQTDVLQAYVAAFQAADIRGLVHLCQDGVLDPIQATNRVLVKAYERTAVSGRSRLDTGCLEMSAMSRMSVQMAA